MEVLQTSALPLGYPAILAQRPDGNAPGPAVNGALGWISSGFTSFAHPPIQRHVSVNPAMLRFAVPELRAANHGGSGVTCSQGGGGECT